MARQQDPRSAPVASSSSAPTPPQALPALISPPPLPLKSSNCPTSGFYELNLSPEVGSLSSTSSSLPPATQNAASPAPDPSPPSASDFSPLTRTSPNVPMTNASSSSPPRNRMSRPRPPPSENLPRRKSSKSSGSSFKRPPRALSPVPGARLPPAVTRLSHGVSDRSSVCSSNARSSLLSTDSVTFGQVQKVDVRAGWVMPLFKSGVAAHEKEAGNMHGARMSAVDSEEAARKEASGEDRKIFPLGRALTPPPPPNTHPSSTTHARSESLPFLSMTATAAPSLSSSRSSSDHSSSSNHFNSSLARLNQFTPIPDWAGQYAEHVTNTGGSSRPQAARLFSHFNRQINAPPSHSKLDSRSQSSVTSLHFKSRPPPVQTPPVSVSFPRQQPLSSSSAAHAKAGPSKARFKSRKQLSLSLKNTFNSISTSFSSNNLSSSTSFSRRKSSTPSTPRANQSTNALPPILPPYKPSPPSPSHMRGHLRSKSASTAGSLLPQTPQTPCISRVDSLLQNVSTEVINASLGRPYPSPNATPISTSQQTRLRSHTSPAPFLSYNDPIPRASASTSSRHPPDTDPSQIDTPSRIRSQSGLSLASPLSKKRSNHHKSLTISQPFNPVHTFGADPTSQAALATPLVPSNGSLTRSATMGGRGTKRDSSLWEVDFGRPGLGIDASAWSGTGKKEGHARKSAEEPRANPPAPVLFASPEEEMDEPKTFLLSQTTSSGTPSSEKTISLFPANEAIPLFPPTLAPVRPISPISFDFLPPSKPEPIESTAPSVPPDLREPIWDAPIPHHPKRLSANQFWASHRPPPSITSPRKPTRNARDPPRGGEGQDVVEQIESEGDEEGEKGRGGAGGTNLSRRGGGGGSRGTFGQRRRSSSLKLARSSSSNDEQETSSFVTASEFHLPSRPSTPPSSSAHLPPLSSSPSSRSFTLPSPTTSSRSRRISPWQLHVPPSTSFRPSLDHPLLPPLAQSPVVTNFDIDGQLEATHIH